MAAFRLKLFLISVGILFMCGVLTGCKKMPQCPENELYKGVPKNTPFDLSSVSPFCDEILKIVPVYSGGPHSVLQGMYCLAVKDGSYITFYAGLYINVPGAVSSPLKLSFKATDIIYFNNDVLLCGVDDSSGCGIFCSRYYTTNGPLWKKQFLPEFSQITCMASYADTLYCTGISKNNFYQIAKITRNDTLTSTGYNYNISVQQIGPPLTNAPIISKIIAVNTFGTHRRFILLNTQPNPAELLLIDQSNSIKTLIPNLVPSYEEITSLKLFNEQVYGSFSSGIFRFDVRDMFPTISGGRIPHTILGYPYIADIIAADDTIFACGKGGTSNTYSEYNAKNSLSSVFKFDSANLAYVSIHSFGENCFMSNFNSGLKEASKIYVAGFQHRAITTNSSYPNWYINPTSAKPDLISVDASDIK